MGAFGIVAGERLDEHPPRLHARRAGKPVNVHVVCRRSSPRCSAPSTGTSWSAWPLTAGYVVAGVYAVGLLRGRRDRYHRLGFTVPFTVAAILTPVQFMLGDAIARSVFHKQPVKFAATEIVWKTDTHVPEYMFGRLHPDGTISGGIKIPQLDSILAGFSPETKVTG